MSAAGTFRDMTTHDLQIRIKKLIAEMGWTQAQAARCVHCEVSESDDEGEIARYVEVFKKRLSRSSTSPDHLKVIFDILSFQRAAQRTGRVKPTYVPGPHLDPLVQREMQAISRDFDQDLEG